MRVVLATNHLGLGGSESYLLTVAEQLDRLGHEPIVCTREPGAGVGVAQEREIPVVDFMRLPAKCDAVLAQDASVSLELAARYGQTPQVFVAHSDIFDLQTPPQLDGAVGTLVALNDRIANRLRAMALDAEVVRLRQPIDTERFIPQGPLPDIPRRLLLFSNNLVADRMAMLEAACEAAGLEIAYLGGASPGEQVTDIRSALAAVDIVVGYGRSILEAMACGRAAYVYDRHGGDGWVTAQTYAELEAGGFAGRGDRVTVDATLLAEDLKRYSPSMGPVNHDLAMAHHRAGAHTESLVGLLRGSAPTSHDPNTPLSEMARLVRLEWRAKVDAQSLVVDNARLHTERNRFEQARASEIAAAARATAQRYEATLSWRLTAPLRAVVRFFGCFKRRS